MSKYTPGPWALKHISGSNFAVQRFEVRSGSGMPHPIFSKDTSAIDGTSVCMSPQDANLIAAAPDLFEALDEAMSMLGSRLMKDTFGYEWHEKASAAIAKAKGTLS